MIDNLIAELRQKGVKGVDAFEKKLFPQMNDAQRVRDLACEVKSALMFDQNGFQVTMRESPDLIIELDNEIVYVEIKRIRMKEKDKNDFKRMENSELLVRIDSKVEDGDEAWEQIVKVAISKVLKFKEDAPYLLVVVTDSNTIGGHYLKTAVMDYEEQAIHSNEKKYYKLNAIMMIDQWIGKKGNVFFEKTHFVPIKKISDNMISRLSAIKYG